MKLMTKKINLKITIEETAERHPVPVLGTDYKVKIIYKNIKVAELDVEDKIIKISLPNKYKKANNERILDIAIDKMYEQIAKVEVERAMEKTRYDREIIDYIVLHEYCHLKYKSHCKSFIKMLEKYEPNYKKYERIVANI